MTERGGGLAAAGAYIYLSLDDAEHLPPGENIKRKGSFHCVRHICHTLIFQIHMRKRVRSADTLDVTIDRKR